MRCTLKLKVSTEQELSSLDACCYSLYVVLSILAPLRNMNTTFAVQVIQSSNHPRGRVQGTSIGYDVPAGTERHHYLIDHHCLSGVSESLSPYSEQGQHFCHPSLSRGSIRCGRLVGT